MYNFNIDDEPFATAYINSGSDSIYVSTGAGYKAAARKIKVSFDPETGFPVLDASEMACFSHFSSGQTANFDLLKRKAEASADYGFIAEYMSEYDVGRHIWESFTKNEFDTLISSAGWGGTWGGHAVPDLADFARVGTDGMREKVAKYKAKNPGAEDFYKGLELTLDAIDILGERIYEASREEYSRTGNAKLKKTVSAFERCPKKPARTFAEAVSVYVFVFSLDGVDSPGHFDQYMIDFWRSSDPDESREALRDLWLFFHKTRTWNLCISGSDGDGGDLTNELSYEILRVTREFGFETPNLTMRCHEGTPDALWREAMETVASGVGMPALYNDAAVCPALESLGIPKDDAHRYVMNGCNQIDIQGKSHMGLEDGEVNLAAALVFALTSGYHPVADKVIGAATPRAEEIGTFDEFMSALKAQIRHVADAVCSMANKSQECRAKYSSNPIRSLTTAGCVERGLDYKNRGPLYGHGQILAEGVADCVDSVANIKKFVFEDGKYTLAEVRDAIIADYVGYEEMYADFKSSRLNFGNDLAYVDGIAKEIVDYFNSYLRTKRTWRGGFYSGGCSPFDRAAKNGAATGALPNGKRRGESLFADSIGATPGHDVAGPTALLSSCLVYDHTLPASGFILNLKFDKSLIRSDVGKEKLLSLVKTYFKNGGQQLTLTVVSKEDLEDALVHPERHRDLIVRVGGYSAYFVDLSRELKENVIKRTLY